MPFASLCWRAQLRTHLEQLPAVETWFGWQLKRFEQNEAQVTLELAGPDGARRTISCGYMIGADGASSLVRTTLGAHLEGETFAERWLIVDLDNSPAASRETQVFCDSRRPCIALPGPHGTRRFEFKLHRDEKTDAMLDPEQVARLLASHRADPDSVIRRQTVYTFHARVASRWSFGRVHLAGDACHLTPPFAGQGMNSGIRDAHNLAWKLAAVVSGQIGPGLLDTYERERRPHVGEMIKLALRMGRIMGPTSPLAGAIVQSGFRALSLWPGARDYFAQMKYKPKPRFADGFLLKDAVSARRTAVGRLLPQPRVSTQDHDAILLDELLGDGFVLLALTDDVDRFAQETSQEAFARLRVRRIAATSAGTAADNGITAIHDPSGALAAFAYGKPGQVLLIRPDRYVAGSFALSETAAFAQRLDALLRHMGSPPAPAQMALARPEARERA